MTPTRTAICSASSLLALSATGCASLTRSTYQAPALPTAPGWEQQADAAITPYAGPWWQSFGDAELSALVERVLAENADLAVAGIKLRQARMSMRLAASQLLPTLDGSLSVGASKSVEGNASWSNSSTASFGATWEVDLFGRLDAERDAARWEAVATERDLAATRLSLIGTTASSWWQLAFANERIAIGEQSLAYARKALDLVRLQYRAGAVSSLNLRDAEQTVASQEATQTQLVQARVEARNTLAALLGRQVYDGPERQALPAGDLPAVDAGLPASLLARRPDLAAAELRLRKALATADATRASFYPALTLTGAIGTASDSLLGFFNNPVANVGAALSLPFLNLERVRLSTKIAQADYDIAVQQFRQSFYNALRDTANALSARTQYAQQAKALERSYYTARAAEQLYERQYRSGAVPLRSWLDAQERRRSAENSLIANRLDRLNAQATLYQALGGRSTAAP